MIQALVRQCRHEIAIRNHRAPVVEVRLYLCSYVINPVGRKQESHRPGVQASGHGILVVRRRWIPIFAVQYMTCDAARQSKLDYRTDRPSARLLREDGRCRSIRFTLKVFSQISALCSRSSTVDTFDNDEPSTPFAAHYFPSSCCHGRPTGSAKSSGGRPIREATSWAAKVVAERESAHGESPRSRISSAASMISAALSCRIRAR